MLKIKDYDKDTIEGTFYEADIQLEIRTTDDLFEIEKNKLWEYIFHLFCMCLYIYLNFGQIQTVILIYDWMSTVYFFNERSEKKLR